MSAVTLQSNIRSSLISLQTTADLLATSQNRLATGKKVNSALDNPLNFTIAQGLNDRSDSLTSLLDGMSNGVQTIQAANKGIDSINANLKSIQGIVAQAKSAAAASTTAVTGTGTALTGATTFTGAAGDKFTITNSSDNSTTNVDISAVTNVQGVIDAINTGTGGNYTASIDGGKLKIVGSSARYGQTFNASVTNASTVSTTKTNTLLGSTAAVVSAISSPIAQSTLTSYATQINDLLDSINEIAADSGFNGVNLLQAGTSLQVNFNKDSSSAQNVAGQDTSVSGLGLTKIATPASATFAAIDGFGDLATAATDKSRSFQNSLATSLSIIQTRQDFSKSMVNILQTGSSNLVNADTNEEAAKVLALQTQQSLSQSALSLANQANQGVLQLLR